MFLIIRIFLELIRSSLKPHTSADQDIVRHFWVMPHDLDFNGHMSNNRYHIIMDYSALRLMSDTGILITLFKKRWFPIVGCSLISHRRPLHLFDRFSVKSRIIYTDKVWCYISHSIERKGKVIAAANRKYALVSKRKLINPQKIVGEHIANQASLSVQSWIEAENKVIDIAEFQKDTTSQTQSTSVQCKQNPELNLIEAEKNCLKSESCLYSQLECSKSLPCAANKQPQTLAID